MLNFWKLPVEDRRHIYRIIEGLITLIAIIVLAVHGADGGHGAGLDKEDGIGLIGLLSGAKLGYHLLFQKEA